MSEKEAADAAETGDAVADAPEAVVSNDAPEVNEVETEARDMGWVPQNEWRGPAEKWRPADEFVKRGNEILPIIRAREKAKDAEIAKLRADVSTHADTLKRMERMTQVALDRQREQIEAKFSERKELAVETGDKEAFRQAEKDERAALRELDEKVKAEPEKPSGPPPDEQEAFLDWHEENPWFESVPEMTKLANIRFERIKRADPNKPFPEVLAEVRKAVEERFPDKFGSKPAARRPSPVEGGSRVPNGGAPENAARRLPADVRAVAERYVKEGLFKSVDDYAAKYFE